jgi:uncharacterized protein with HEPN domain
MRSKSPFGALSDIKQNVELARAFISGFTFTAFRADQRTAYAIARCLEVISEASRRLPTELKDRHPNIPWRDIAALGSVYRHDYERVRDDVMWRTVQESLSPLLTVVEQELGRLSKG